MERGQEKLFICDCNSPQHQIVFCYDEEDNLLYAMVHLNKLSFWRRIKVAVLYLFGKQSNYGAFDEFIFRKEDGEKLQEVAAKLKSEKYGVFNS